MQKLCLFGFCLAFTLCSGCVATTFKHEIAVVRDADGKIIQTIETEGIEQPNAQSLSAKIKFKTLELPK